jgi:hypothetical protein
LPDVGISPIFPIFPEIQETPLSRETGNAAATRHLLRSESWSNRGTALQRFDGGWAVVNREQVDV